MTEYVRIRQRGILAVLFTHCGTANSNSDFGVFDADYFLMMHNEGDDTDEFQPNIWTDVAFDLQPN